VTRLARGAQHAVDPRDVERLSVPDSPACREADRVCREACGASLAAHCFRTYGWAAFLGARDGVSWGAELLYTAAMLHDLGLTPGYDRGGCFETDGAEAARAILSGVGWTQAQLDLVAEAIYLHMHEVTPEHSVEARLLALGAAADVTGRRIDEVSDQARSFVLALFPRHGFKREILARFEDQARRKPACVLHQYLGSGLADRVIAAPFAE
jgi:HD domain-containing protein